MCAFTIIFQSLMLLQSFLGAHEVECNVITVRLTWSRNDLQQLHKEMSVEACNPHVPNISNDILHNFFGVRNETRVRLIKVARFLKSSLFSGQMHLTTTCLWGLKVYSFDCVLRHTEQSNAKRLTPGPNGLEYIVRLASL